MPDIIALGFDQHFDVGDLERGLADRGFDTEVVRVKVSNSGRLCSTRRIIDRILEMNKI
jgi:FAD synthetase